MQNKQADIKEIEATVEFAGCYNAPAAAARDAAKVIDDVFVVIHRDELPDSTDIDLTYFKTGRKTFTYHDSPEEMRETGLIWLAAADHLEGTKEQKAKEREEAQRILSRERYDVYCELFPTASTTFGSWNWNNRNEGTKKAITEILKLRKELASGK